MTEPNPTPWAHVDVDALRATYDAAVHANDPVYEDGDICESCGRFDMWLQVPPRQELSTRTKTIAATGEVVGTLVDVTDYPETRRCGWCLTWKRQ